MSGNSFYDVSWQEDFFVFKANGKCYCILCPVVFPGNTKRNDVMIHYYTRHVHANYIIPRRPEEREAFTCMLKEQRKVDIILGYTNTSVSLQGTKERLKIVVGIIFENFQNPKIMEELQALGLSKEIILRGIEYCLTDVSTSISMCFNISDLIRVGFIVTERLNYYVSLLHGITVNLSFSKVESLAE